MRLLDAGVIGSTPVNDGKGTLAVAGRFSYSGLIARQFTDEVKLSYWDYQARFDHQLAGGKFTFLLLDRATRFSSKKIPRHPSCCFIVFPPVTTALSSAVILTCWSGGLGDRGHHDS